MAEQADIFVLPPPTGGLNARDALAAMPPTDACEMENWFPEERYVRLRRGYRQHAKSVGIAYVYGLANFSTSAGVEKLLAFSAQEIYDVSSAGAATALTKGAGVSISSGQWKSVNFAGRWFAVNGGDPPVDWDGSGSPGTLNATAWTGISAKANLKHIACYKRRLYFLEKETAKIWYGSTDAKTGALVSYDASPYLSKGGSLKLIATTNRQVGQTDAEQLVVVSERGEILIFSGSYPGATSWDISAHVFSGEVLGANAFFYYGGQLHLITDMGIVGLNSLLAGPNLDGLYTTLSDQINPAINATVESLVASVGESGSAAILDFACVGAVYPRGRYLLVNIPISADGGAVQFAMNLYTRKWTKFTNQNAQSWCLFKKNLYFGCSPGKVMRADYVATGAASFDENPASEGNAVAMTCKLTQAFNPLGDSRKNKKVAFVRPSLGLQSTSAWTSDVDVNFKLRSTASTNSAAITTTATFAQYDPEIQVAAFGKSIAVRHDASTVYPTTLFSTEIGFIPGGVR